MHKIFFNASFPLDRNYKYKVYPSCGNQFLYTCYIIYKNVSNVTAAVLLLGLSTLYLTFSLQQTTDCLKINDAILMIFLVETKQLTN